MSPCSRRSAAHFVVALVLPAIAICGEGESVPALASANSQRAVVQFSGALPLGVSSFGAATLGGYLYVLGGYFGKVHDYRAEFQSAAFYRIDLMDSSNVELLRNDGGVQGATLTVIGDRIVRVGGMRVVDGKEQSLADCRGFDPDAPNKGWVDLPALPQSRSSHDAASLGRVLYVCGGWTMSPAGKSWPGAMLALDLDHTDAGWVAIDQPFRRRGVGCVGIAGRVVVIGGMDEQNTASTSVDVYDPKSGEWTKGPDFPGRGFGVAVTSVGERIIANGEDGVLYSWSVGESAWTSVGTLNSPRFFHRLVTTSSFEILALGGIHGGVRPRAIESIALGERATKIASHAVIDAQFALPNPSPARNRQGMFLRGDSLYVFGGNDSLEQHEFGPGHFRDESFRVDLATRTCTRLTSFPVRRQSMVVDADEAGERVIALGGFGHDGESARTWSDAFEYDVENDRWTPSALALDVPRSQFGLAHHGAERLVFGGLDFDPKRVGTDRFHYPMTVLSTRGGGGFIDSSIAIPTPRRAFASAVLGERFYLVGGMRAEFEPVSTCDVFDFATNSWSSIASPPRTRISAQLIALDGKLYLMGGSSRGEDGGDLEPDGRLEVFDPGTNAWSTLIDELPISPSHLRAFAWRHHLLLVSTQDADRAALHVLSIRPPMSSEESRDVSPGPRADVRLPRG